MLSIPVAELVSAVPPAPRQATHAAKLYVSHAFVRAVTAPLPSTRVFASIPPQAIAQFFPRSLPSDRFSTNHFPPLPRNWPASRQRWNRRAMRTPQVLRSYWLQSRAVQYR